MKFSTQNRQIDIDINYLGYQKEWNYFLLGIAVKAIFCLLKMRGCLQIIKTDPQKFLMLFEYGCLVPDAQPQNLLMIWI